MKKFFLTLVFWGNIMALQGVYVPEVLEVDKGTVLLGEVFKGGIENQGQTLIARLHQGEECFLTSQALLEIAFRNWIDWTPPKGFKGVRIQHVNTKPVEKGNQFGDNLDHYLESKIPNTAYTWDIRTKSLLEKIRYRSGHDLTIQSYEASPPYFTVHVRGQSGKVFQLNGRLHTPTKVPVLIKDFTKGDTILAEDLAWIQIDEKDVRPGTIMDWENIIGKKVRGSVLKSNTPLKKSDLEIAYETAKGKPVTIVAQSANFFITAKGQALENGINSDLIKVKNADSGRIIQAKVVGENVVEVPLPLDWGQKWEQKRRIQ